MCWLSGCPSNTSKAASNAAGGGINIAQSLGGFGAGSAPKTLQDATSAVGKLNIPLDYFLKILSGDPTALGEAIAPEVQSLTSQYDVARKTVEETLPAGGEKNATLAELPFRQASEVATLTGQARSSAATGAAGIASNIVQLLLGIGTAEGQLGLGGAETSIYGSEALNEIDKTNSAKAQSAGEAIGALLALLASA